MSRGCAVREGLEVHVVTLDQRWVVTRETACTRRHGWFCGHGPRQVLGQQLAPVEVCMFVS